MLIGFPVILNKLLVKVRRSFGILSKSTTGVPEPERRSRERYRLIALSGAASIAAKIVTALVGLASVPMIVHYVGKDQFGLWMVVSSLVVWMQLADFGITNGLTNALSEAYGRDDPEAASSYLSAALALTLLIALICLLPLFAAYLWVPWARVLKLAQVDLAAMANNAFLLVGLAFVINIPVSLVTRVYGAYQRSYVTSLTQAISSVVSFLGMWVAVQCGVNLLWLVAISVFTPVLLNLGLWLWISNLDMAPRVRYVSINRGSISRVANSSVPLFFFQCGALLVNQLVNFIIARVANLSLVADYNMILRIYLFVFAIAAAFSGPFYAAIREAFERSDRRWVTKAIQRSVVVRSLALVPFSLVLLPFGDEIMRRWIGVSDASAIGLFGWACVISSLVLVSISSLLSETLSSLDDIWSQIGIVFLSAIIVVGLMLFLIPKWGVSGVFFAMAASTLIPIFWLTRRLKQKFIHQ